MAARQPGTSRLGGAQYCSMSALSPTAAALLADLIFFDAPWWAFVAAYSAFAALVLLTWWWVPPRRRSSP